MHEVAKKPIEVTKEVAYDTIPAAPKDQSKEKEASHNMEIFLVTLNIPTKEDLKGKGPTSSWQPPPSLARLQKTSL